MVRVDLSAEGYEAASAWLAVREGVPAAEDVRRAIDALFEGRSVDFTGLASDRARKLAGRGLHRGLLWGLRPEAATEVETRA